MFQVDILESALAEHVGEGKFWKCVLCFELTTIDNPVLNIMAIIHIAFVFAHTWILYVRYFCQIISISVYVLIWNM